MSFQDIIFYLFSAILIASALGVITFRNPVYSALLLVLSFITCAGLWLLLEAEFLAITLVLVYVGAVMVLFFLHHNRQRDVIRIFSNDSAQAHTT